MTEFEEILTLYYGDYPGLRAAKLLGVTGAAVSQWRHGKRKVPAYAIKKLLRHQPNRVKEIRKTAARLRARLNSWEDQKIAKCHMARTKLQRADERQFFTALEETTPAREEEPHLNQRSSDTALRKRAISSQAPLSSTGLRPPTTLPQAADTNSPSALLHQDGTSACTPQSSVQDGPPISQSQAQPMRVSPPLRGNAAKPRLLPGRRSS